MSKVLKCVHLTAAVFTLSLVSLSAQAQSTLLSNQNGTFRLNATTTVQYGANGKFNQKSLTAGTYVCDD